VRSISRITAACCIYLHAPRTPLPPHLLPLRHPAGARVCAPIYYKLFL